MAACRPAVCVLFFAVTYLQARRALASVLPVGSVASTTFLDDRFISRNAGGTREISFGDVRGATVRGDLVLLTLASQRGRMLIARDLVPDEMRERFAARQA